jgi:lipoyl(octanoyl) transferase
VSVALSAAGRVEGRSGVWLPADDRRPERKVTAIGVQAGWGHAHGFALSSEPELRAYDRIMLCGNDG